MEKINFIKEKKFPKDYHTDVFENFYKGRLIKLDGTPYSARERNKYYSPFEKKHKHLCPGHWQGFRFIIQQFTSPNDWVFDGTCGSGTALIESFIQDRNSIGIELEFAEIARKNIEYIKKNNPQINVQAEVIQGDTRNIDKFLTKKECFDLIVTGTPYQGESDSPERKNLASGTNFSFSYENSKNLSMYKKEEDYFEELKKVYLSWSKYLKSGGYFCFIIKDLIKNKSPYLLHKKLADLMISTKEFKMHSVYLHYHYPPTLFMSTYNKRFPNVKIPKYQTMVVLKKK